MIAQIKTKLKSKRPLRDDYRYSISNNYINKEIKAKSNPSKAPIDFVTHTSNMDDFINLIKKGVTISPSTFNKNYRNQDNVINSDIWVGDIDKKITIEKVLEIDFFKKYSFIYTSFRHTDEDHRFRIVIPLPSSIDAITYKEICSYLNNLIDGCFDPTPMHPAAMFHGNTNAQIFNYENIEGLDYEFIINLEKISNEKRELALVKKREKALITQERIKNNPDKISDSKQKALSLIPHLPPREKGSGQYNSLRNAIWGLCALWTIESDILPDTTEYDLALDELSDLIEDSPSRSDLSQKWDVTKLILSYQPEKIGKESGISGASFFALFKDTDLLKSQDLNSTPTRTKKPKKIKIAYELIDEIFKDRLKLNLLDQNIELDGTIADLDNFYIDLAINHNIEVSDKLAFDIACQIAKKNQYHPIRQYFESLNDHPEQSINIRQLATNLFGTEDAIYNEMLYRFLIASVARIFRPGCKVDTMLVLQGKTGYRKSTFFKILYGKDYFSDSVQSFDKDSLMTMHQYWACELAELESITSKKEAGEMKAFLSRAIDTFRRPYAKSSTANKRQGVIVGSVNESEFLIDTTGNRRFWIIPINNSIDTDLIAKWRDRIWYLAYQDYLKGEKWILSESEENQNLEMNEQYLYSDPWVTTDFISFLENISDEKRTSNYIFTVFFKFESRDIHMGNSKRLGKILNSLGYQNRRKSFNGQQLRIWIKEK